MARQDVSVLATRPSCGDGQGMTYFLLGLYVWPLVGADWGEIWVWPPFFPCSELVAGSIRYSTTALVLGADRLCSYGVPPPCPSPLRSYGLGIGILLRLAGFGLQFDHGSPYWWSSWEFSVLSLIRSWWIVCLGVITRTRLETWQWAPLFFRSGRTYSCKTKTCTYITLVRHIRICKRRDVIQKLCDT